VATVPFTRPTIVAAVSFLSDRLGQAAFNHMVLRLGLESDIPSDTTIKVAKKADRLGRIAVQRTDERVETLEGTLGLAEAVIREAVQLMRSEPHAESEVALGRGLARDGYTVSFDDDNRPHFLTTIVGEDSDGGIGKRT
jgi:hypothetical protein